ncbi:MAG: hypothetical protein F4Y01_14870 [Gammaproteobacteria bacterium]|nr:hypothetical protein [Gammaproteobacteria bacterium]
MARRFVPWLAVVVGLGGPFASAAEEVTPPHVFQAARQMAADVDALRDYMGRREVTAAGWVVDYAEPRHVYYQAQTLARKANRLVRQINGAETALPEPPIGEILPGHVLGLVQGAHQAINSVQQEIGAPAADGEVRFDADRAPRDVLREIVQINRQINLMLDIPIRPEDVYGRIELAAAYVAGKLTDDPAEPVYGTLPAFETGKQPVDVYRRVLTCLGIAQRIGESRGIRVLDLNLRREERRRDIEPSDVYHLATTLLAELAYLTLELDAHDVDLPPIEKPAYIFPSHVFRMAGMLEDELNRLEASL